LTIDFLSHQSLLGLPLVGAGTFVMRKIARHFVFTIAMIAWAGICLYLMEEAQQVALPLYLSPFQSTYRALVGAALVLVMLFPGFLYKKSFPD
jgi:hypothetical protein